MKPYKLSAAAGSGMPLRASVPEDERPQQPERAAREIALARLLMHGEPAAGAALWDHFSPLVRGLLGRSLGPEDGTEDALQEIFLLLYRKGPTLRDPARLRSFVVAVTVNYIRSELRKRRVRRAIMLPLRSASVLSEVAAEAAPVNVPRLALMALYRALDGLTVGERLAFTLRFFEGLELAEASALSQTSPATFKRRLLAAKQKLRAAALADPWLSAYVQAGLDKETDGAGGQA